MLASMKRTYCKGGKGTKMTFTDGSSTIVCTKARTVFYATMRKNGWDETKPRKKGASETVDWFLRLRGVKDV